MGLIGEHTQSSGTRVYINVLPHGVSVRSYYDEDGSLKYRANFKYMIYNIESSPPVKLMDRANSGVVRVDGLGDIFDAIFQYLNDLHLGGNGANAPERPIGI